MALEVKTAKNSKLPKLPENCFEPVGKGGWPSISKWITEFAYMDAKNYTADPCEKYTKKVSVAMNRKMQMRLHANSCHSHEHSLVEPVSKPI
jgi:hypothetical protein